MAICTFCKHDMLDGVSCTETALHVAGVAFPLAPYRASRRLRLDYCGDCGAPVGGHHHPGCDLQDCPRCRNQLISCGCPFDEHAAEREADEIDDLDEVDDRPERAEIVAFRRAEPAAPLREIPPFGPAVAELRAKHREALATLATWALVEGRGVDLDVAAACLEAMAPRLTGAGILLTRVDVCHLIMCDLRNLASLHGTCLPDGDMEAVWATLTWCHERGRLAPTSDPLPALREPLQCYGMLGADGRPRPEGTDVAFVCQCHLPHDPSVPPGQAQRVIGRNPETGRLLVVTGHIRQRSEDPPVSCLRPLLTMARRSRQEDWVVPVPADAFTYEGRIPAAQGVPDLWLYLLTDRGRGTLLLDEDGRAWQPRTDGRRKAGFRLVPVDGPSAMHRSGAFRLVIEEERRRDDTVVDLWDAR